MRRTILALALLALLPGRAVPDDSDERWDALKALRVGQKIRVTDTSFSKMEGSFLDISGEFLKLRVKGRDLMLEREKVMVVSLRKGSTGKQILLAILGGALLGVSLWAEMNQCEKHGCWDPDTGWYEGSGKGLSRRSAYIATGVGAGALGIMAIFAGKSEKVIYSHNPVAPYFQAPLESLPAPDEAGQPEGGNVFAPLTTGPEDKTKRLDGSQPQDAPGSVAH